MNLPFSEVVIGFVIVASFLVINALVEIKSIKRWMQLANHSINHFFCFFVRLCKKNIVPCVSYYLSVQPLGMLYCPKILAHNLKLIYS